MILDHIKQAKEMNSAFVYLGYWVKGSEKMRYKSEYKPVEIYYQNKWLELTPETEVTLNVDRGLDLPELSESNNLLPVIQLPRV